MLTISLVNGTPPTALTVEAQRCIIGRSPECQVNLQGWRVSRRHAEIFISNERVYVRDLDSTFGTLVNEEKLEEARPLSQDCIIRIGNHALSVRLAPAAGGKSATPGATDGKPTAAVFVPDVPTLPMPLPEEAALAPVHQVSAPVAAVRPVALDPMPLAPSPELFDEMFKYRRILHDRLLDAFDVRRTDTHRMADNELREVTERLITDLIARIPDLPPSISKRDLLDQVRDEAIGLGPLEPLLADPSITEIMVNRADEVFVERAGRLTRWPVAFTSDRAVQGIIERIVAPIGRRIDESSPMVDARLKDGSRVNAIIPPLALKGPSITIRKFSKRKLAAQDLIDFGSADADMVEFLKVCVVQRKNVLISGGTGSGKTTLLNILSNFIPDDERIVTIEDAAELQLHHTNLVSMEARPANIEGKGLVTIRDLVRNSLRMRPDRIVVGECRGGESLDMLQAMNTGHDGSLTTAHANSPRDMLARMEVMVLMAGMDLPVTAIREQIASAVDIIVQQTRFACGSRKITNIVEVTGVESGKIQLQEVFSFVQTGITRQGKTGGYFTGRGFVPEFYEELTAIGIPLRREIFNMRTPEGPGTGGAARLAGTA